MTDPTERLTTADHLRTPEGSPPNVVWDDYRDELRYMTVVECMGRIIAELPAIGKTQRNTQQGFNFPGIDDVQNALTPLLGRYGVVPMPHVLERIASTRTTNGGGTMYEINLHVRYTFYGPGGDSIVGSGWGEGTDLGDKATSKAMTTALKDVLFQALQIATSEQSEADADRTTPEESQRPRGFWGAVSDDTGKDASASETR
jgi:ERF superfamily